MPQLVDCYCFVDSRKKKLVDDFLDKFLPRREDTIQDFVVNKKSTIIEGSDELMFFLEQNLSEEKTIYWKNTDENSTYMYAMAFFTDDGKLIIGVSISGRFPDEKLVVDSFFEIKEYLNSTIGCITVEEAAPTNSQEFIEFCNNRYVPHK